MASDKKDEGELENELLVTARYLLRHHDDPAAREARLTAAIQHLEGLRRVEQRRAAPVRYQFRPTVSMSRTEDAGWTVEVEPEVACVGVWDPLLGDWTQPEPGEEAEARRAVQEWLRLPGDDAPDEPAE